ncbi:GNAT family N-acetyltransferase [Flavobacterium rhizosphaerae]|uniref:GNAT family N-acetyltransferase n=1 Tax=Flavobacterium rhizosphaerae TaxID=3163298 RepID=A0ABW8YWS3_9FLAO
MDVMIREIQPDDNPYIAAVIRTVFEELDAPKTGTAYADTSLDNLFKNYNKPNSVYYIAQQSNGQIAGGAGIAPLDNGPDGVCELQKMYFLKTIRSTGTGAAMIQKCLQAAKSFGFTQCYLETLTDMHAAQKLYVKSGFTYLNAPLGNTGHSSCPVWMIKELV